MIDLAVVVAADAPIGALERVPRDAPVIAADGGAVAARIAGLTLELVVGDLDSLSGDEVEALEAAGVAIERHPPDKDASDLELALAAALAREPRRVLVVGSAAGRLDQLLGIALLLGAEAYASVEVDAVLGDAGLHVVRGERVLRGAPGELVSLFALHGAARGVSTEGLVYPLDGDSLVPGSTRGLSNVFAAAEARITVEDGVVLVVRPGSG